MFPFPYVQLLVLLLLSYTLLAPFAVSAIVNHIVWAPCLVFFPVFGCHALNFISMELEDPFGDDPNDLPLAHFQTEMNSCLLMLLHPGADIITGTSHRCVRSFDKLYEAHRHRTTLDPAPSHYTDFDEND